MRLDNPDLSIQLKQTEMQLRPDPGRIRISRQPSAAPACS